MIASIFFFQAEDGIRDLVRSRGLGDVYKRQVDLGLSYDQTEQGLTLSVVVFDKTEQNLTDEALRLSLIHI